MSGTLKLSGALQVGSLAAAPSNPQVGFQYYDSTLGKYLTWDGSQWTEPASFEVLAGTDGAAKVGIADVGTLITATDVEGALQENRTQADLGVTNAATAQSAIDSHIDGGVSKHDASEIDLEAVDGKNHSAGSVEAVVGELDDAIGSLAANPANYTPTNAAIVADHLASIDIALANAGGTSFTDDVFEVKDNLDNTKKVVFQAASISTGTTRTITMADVDVDLADIATNADNIVTYSDHNNLTNIGINTHDQIDSHIADTAQHFTEDSIDHINIQNIGTNSHAAIDTFIASKAQANGLASLGVDGKIPQSQVPAIALTDTFVVANETAMLALTVQTGDVAVRTDLNKSFILKGTDGSVLADWQELLTPTDAVTSVNGLSGVVILTTDEISEGTAKYYATSLFNADLATKSTSDLAEGTNEYFTVARAKAAAVADSITDAVTDVAPSQNAVFDALAGKLANVVEDTTPELGGDLTLGANVVIHDANGMKRGSSASNFLEEEYVHNISLLASQAATVISELTFPHASFEGLEVVYKIKEATSNDVRIGTIRVVTNGSVVSINDLSLETADTGVNFSAAINGANVEIKYNSGANGATMRADLKRFKV